MNFTTDETRMLPSELRVLAAETSDKTQCDKLIRAAECIEALAAENFELRHLLPPRTWRHPDGCSICGTGKSEPKLVGVNCQYARCPSRLMVKPPVGGFSKC